MTPIHTPSTLSNAINSKTLIFFLLSFASVGVYLVLWVFKTYPIIDRVTGAKTADEHYVIWIAICLGLYGLLGNTNDDALVMIALLLFLGYQTLLILWAFRARKALQDYAIRDLGITLTLNPFLTFGFNVYYINFSINKLATLTPPALHSPDTP